jgi:hypothetical protein
VLGQRKRIGNNGILLCNLTDEKTIIGRMTYEILRRNNPLRLYMAMIESLGQDEALSATSTQSSTAAAAG